METEQIDIVITWVDSSDPNWNMIRNDCLQKEGKTPLSENTDVRFRDWDIVRFLLRSIEKYTPWVRTVHFVTAGHLPKWMNLDAPKLHIVKHSDFIPSEYLPTFSSHAIELNLHRIDGLARQFININDDILFLQELKANEFFKNGLPRDYAILDALISTRRYSTADIGLTDAEVINDHFNKNKVIRRNITKWFNPRYGMLQIKTALLMPWKLFSDFQGRHFAIPYLKDTFEELWEKEYELLDMTCKHKFRTPRDVNQWLVRDWQLVSGTFKPISPKGNKYYNIRNDDKKMINSILFQDCKMICLNDVELHEALDVDMVKDHLVNALEKVFPDKSVFEE